MKASIMKVFITGITGTLGTAIAQYHHSQGDEVVGCGRSESKLADWMSKYSAIGTAWLGDCLKLWEPYYTLRKLLTSCQRVYHCAALKHVDLCERQPVEAYKQNLDSVDIVSDICWRHEIPLVFISSDKACLPQGVYGATKLIGEQIVVSRGGAVVRFGNLIGSSGSVFQKWAEAVKRGEPIQLTDPEMTRYFISVDSAAKFAATCSKAGQVRMPEMQSIRMGDLAAALEGEVKVIGRRLGETKHQWLVAPGELASVDFSNEVITLGIGSESKGISSSSGSWWEPKELLHLAGVEI